jgi:hypothetical protein
LHSRSSAYGKGFFTRAASVQSDGKAVIVSDSERSEVCTPSLTLPHIKKIVEGIQSAPVRITNNSRGARRAERGYQFEHRIVRAVGRESLGRGAGRDRKVALHSELEAVEVVFENRGFLRIRHDTQSEFADRCAVLEHHASARFGVEHPLRADIRGKVGHYRRVPRPASNRGFRFCGLAPAACGCA